MFINFIQIAPNWFFKRDTITQVYSSFPEEKWQDQPDRSIDPALSVYLHILWYTFHCFLDVVWPSTFCLLSNFTHFHGKLLWVPYIISLVAKEIEASVLRGLLKPGKNSGYLFRISGWLRTNLEGEWVRSKKSYYKNFKPGLKKLTRREKCKKNGITCRSKRSRLLNYLIEWLGQGLIQFN